MLVEVIGEADANEASGEDELALPGSLVGDSQLRIPRSWSQISYSTIGCLLYLSSLSTTPSGVH